MRFRIRRVTGWAVVMTLLIAGGWLLWRQLAAAQPGTSSARASLTLRVNGARQTEVSGATPVIFELSLRGLGEAAPVIGSQRRPWYSYVRLANATSKNAIHWEAAPTGAPFAVSIPASARSIEEMRVERGDTADLRQGALHQVVFAVPPETMANAAPATYEIVAVLEHGYWPPWEWHGRLTSAPVTVVVRPSGNADERAERDRLTLTTRYYMAARRYEDARRSASELLERDPRNIAAAIMLGDALAALDRRDEALDMYRLALAKSPRSYEQPLLIYERIEKVLRRRTGSR